MHPFVYVPKAACEEQALGRGTKAGDDFIWQHQTLPVLTGTDTHEITINCLQRISLIPDCLKTYKHS